MNIKIWREKEWLSPSFIRGVAFSRPLPKVAALVYVGLGFLGPLRLKISVVDETAGGCIAMLSDAGLLEPKVTFDAPEIVATFH